MSGARLASAVLALAGLAVVGGVVMRAAEDPSPGPLGATHARVAELRGGGGCAACHGDGPDDLTESCLDCHAPVARQIAGGAGFHGGLDAPRRCGACHTEHLAAGASIVGAVAFARAGYDERAAYDHAGLGFVLEGAHDALACDACHSLADAPHVSAGQTRFGGLDQACTACHEDVHEGRLGADCARCHGQDEPFAHAAAFTHTPFFPLVGPHRGLACAECHAPDSAHAIERVGGPDPPPSRACADCHAAPHAPRFLARVDAGCDACHAPQPTGFLAADVDATAAHHAATGFPLVDAHADVACASCHDPGLPFERRYPGRTPRDCASCHEDPHAGQFAEDPASGCARCHEPTAFAPTLLDVPVAHARLGFPLEGGHADVSCAECHAPDAAGVVRWRGVDASCAACHEDPHGGAFADPLAPHGTDCARCHAPTGFRDVDSFDHGADAGWALAGAHARADCTTCHPPDGAARLGPAAALLDGAAVDAATATCADCHADPHGGRFDAVGLPPEVDGRASCARCHGEERWEAVAPDRFDHGRWTGVALEGAHAQAACTSCHVPADEVARRLGAVADAFPGDPNECATCHDDPHGRRFDAIDCPRTIEGRTGCARCHGTVSFRTTNAFEHDWTGWALDGAHAAAACSACHSAPAEDGSALGDVPGTRCADCHVDPHAGQFRDAAGAVDCARCHASTRSFDALSFDHDRDSRFALDEHHARLACAACHVPWRRTDGTEVVRYRPLGRDCADCHGGGR